MGGGGHWGGTPRHKLCDRSKPLPSELPSTGLPHPVHPIPPPSASCTMMCVSLLPGSVAWTPRLRS